MNEKIRIKSSYKMTLDLAVVLFVVFFSMPFFKWGFDKFFDIVGIQSGRIAIVLTPLYISALYLCLKKDRGVLLEFVYLLGAIVVFFLITYQFHPEYYYVYTRKNYGVWPYVLRPDNGIYAFLFVSLIKKPEGIKKGLRISGYIMYAFAVLRLYIALSRGFWLEENYLGETIQLSYSLSFGYQLLIFVCFFMYCGLKEKSVKDMLLFAIGVIMILMGGSRGPLLDIVIFMVLYFIVAIKEFKYRYLYVAFAVVAGILLVLFYNEILVVIAKILEGLNISSRTITKMLNGSLSDDNGRNEIWAAAIAMIKKKPFGYGAMGARYGLYKVHFVGHPHNVFLELFIDYGVIIGSMIILGLIINSIYIINSKDIGEWKYIYLVFLANACQLLTSYTYWHSLSLWALLAVTICIYKEKKQISKKHRTLLLWEKTEQTT